MFSRTQNRLILNEAELLLALAQEFRDEDRDETWKTTPLQTWCCWSATLHAGQHARPSWSRPCSCPAGQLWWSLFPYAVNPDHYTPIRSPHCLAWTSST